MKAKYAILTREERDVLVLAATHPNGQHLNNTDVAQHLGISVNRVKKLIHQACIKLRAHNRNEAILLAIRRGEIRLDELYTFDELAEFWISLCPDVLKRVINLVREGLDHGQLPWKDEEITRKDRRQDTILTKSEQDVLILVGRGLTNKEIANTLYISFNTVRTFLYRVYTKLGTHNRVDAVMLAIKQGEICMDEMFSLDELLYALSTLKAESLEKIAQLLIQNPRQDPVQISI